MRPLLQLVFLSFIFSSAFSQTQKLSISCAASAPDSIFFDTQNYDRYRNGIFNIQTRVWNTGEVIAESLFVFVRSNQRFQIVPPASKFLVDTLLLSDTLLMQFTLIVQPKDVSGFDTVFVTVTGKYGARSECALTLWVEKEYRPRNEILCPPAGSIQTTFDEGKNDYAPNPIAFPIRVINLGDAPSKETRIMFVATPGVSPASGQNPILDAGTLHPSQAIDTVFRLNIVRRTTDTTVDVRFRVQGKGGLGDRIIDTLCTYSLEIPRVRNAALRLECRNDVRITLNQGKYTPNPFDWNITVKNLGEALSKNLRARISFPSSLVLDSTFTSLVSLGDLRASEEKHIRWSIRAKHVQVSETCRVCVDLVDDFNNQISCCDTVLLPAIMQAEAQAQCRTIPDSIFVDATTGAFLPSQCTFQLDCRNGEAALDSVWTKISCGDPSIKLESPAEIFLGNLAPRELRRIEFQMKPLANPTGRNVLVRALVTAKLFIPLQSECEFYVSGSLAPRLACAATTNPSDTLHVSAVSLRDMNNLEHDSLTFYAACQNIGSLRAEMVQATIILPPRMQLRAGESIVQYLPASFLQKDSIWQVQWRLQPMKQKEGVLVTIRVEFSSDNVRTQCMRKIFVVGIPPITTLHLPRNILGQFGEVLTIPIQISDASEKNIHSMRLRIRYDRRKLRFIEIDTANSLTSGWQSTSADLGGEINLEMNNTNSPLRSGGNLIHIKFRALFGDGDDQMRVTGTELLFDTARSLVNGGSVLAKYYHGYIVLSGICIHPLEASEKYVVLSASPNPFGGESTITIKLRKDAHTTLIVYDNLGRRISTLENHFRSSGVYQYPFQREHSSPGMYHCVVFLDGKAIMQIPLLPK